MSIGGLHWYNFWSRYTGALYGIRGDHPTTGRVIFAYGGKTFQVPWEKRIRQHLWGGGQYNDVAKPWADTVLGWRPNGTVQECIAAGGVFLIMKPRRISPFGLWWREILFAIWMRRPYYNSQWNRHNPRRILKSTQIQQRAARDAGLAHSGVSLVGRGELWWYSVRRIALGAVAALIGVAALATGLLFLPDVWGGVSTAATGTWDLIAYHRSELGGGFLALAGAIWLSSRTKTRRRSRGWFRTTRRRTRSRR